MQAILDFITGPLNTVAWMYILLPCVMVGGLFFTIRNRGIQFTKFGYAMKNTIGKIFTKQEAKAGSVTPFQALTTALAATVGTGNIIGTSQAIALGGYGTRCTEYLLGMKVTKIYQVIFILMIVVGATTSLDVAWDVADTFNGLMAIPNFIALFALSGVVAKLTKDYFAKK